jgi:hypothetical protein
VLGPLKSDVIAAALARAFCWDSVPTLQAQFARRVGGRSRFTLIRRRSRAPRRGILPSARRWRRN